MVRRREEEKGTRERRPLAQVQRDKIGLISVGKGEVEFSYSELALALSIPAVDLRSLFEQRRGLVISPTGEDERVVMRVEEFYPGRNLWEEVLRTLRKGRSDARMRRDVYEELQRACKAVKEADGRALADFPVSPESPPLLESLISFSKNGGSLDHSDVEYVDLKLLASIAFASLSDAVQNELNDQGQSPTFI